MSRCPLIDMPTGRHCYLLAYESQDENSSSTLLLGYTTRDSTHQLNWVVYTWAYRNRRCELTISLFYCRTVDLWQIIFYPFWLLLHVQCQLSYEALFAIQTILFTKLSLLYRSYKNLLIRSAVPRKASRFFC